MEKLGLIPELSGGDVPIRKSEETTSLQFKTILTTIQSRSLSPENIDSYAEDALLDLIKLTASITSEYDKQQSINLSPSKEFEDKAFSHFGLDNIEEVLKNVILKDEEIKKLDGIISRAKNINTTLVPPDQEVQLIHEGNGTFKEKSIISRTKTTLFILSNDFDIDINDPKQLSLTTGVLSNNMMRKLSYFMINVPKLNRTILCCDEEGNVTYVFDNAILDNHKISQEDLASLSKQDINDLLQSDSKLGKRIIYSNRFVPNMVNSITDLNINNENQAEEGVGQYLYPKAPEEILSAKSFSTRLGISSDSIYKAIKSLENDFGELNRYRFGPQTAIGFSPEQQDMIKQSLVTKGFFEKKPNEDILPMSAIADKYNVANKTLKIVIEELKDSLGYIHRYHFGRLITKGYTPEQQEIIRQVLENKGILGEKAPEGVLSVHGVATKLGVDSNTVNKIIKMLDDNLGETHKYKFGPQTVIGYTSEQQELIRQKLEDNGNFKAQAPKGILSIQGLATNLNIDYSVVKKVVSELESNLGEVHSYRFRSKIVIGYSPEQQKTIREVLEKRGLFLEKAPENILSLKGLAGKLNVNSKYIAKIISELEYILGETRQYKFTTVVSTGYTLQQQEIIRQALESRKSSKTKYTKRRILS